MKDGSKRTVSRIIAFVMLVSCMLSNVMFASADITDGGVKPEVVASGDSVETPTETTDCC